MKTKLRQEVGRKLAELEKEEHIQRRIDTVTIKNSSFLFLKRNMRKTSSLYYVVAKSKIFCTSKPQS